MLYGKFHSMSTLRKHVWEVELLLRLFLTLALDGGEWLTLRPDPPSSGK